MRIGSPSKVTDGGLVALQAELTDWTEDLTLYVAVPAEHEDLLGNCSEPFLLGCLMSAIKDELPITVEGRVSPYLLAGVGGAMRIYRDWYGERAVPVKARPREEEPGQGTGLFVSGGVDSLASLTQNRLDVPEGYPGSITHLVHVDLLGTPKFGDLGGKLREQQGKTLAHFAFDVVPVVTNLRAVARYEFSKDWMWRSHGSVFAGIAHAFRFERMLLASSFNEAAHLTPWGSHPLVDPLWSSASMTFVHHNAHLSRLEKTRLVADSTPALQSLMVCSRWRDRDGTNCGRCEKCLRTMTALNCLRVPIPETFEIRELTPALISENVRYMHNRFEAMAWEEMLPLLGPELAKVIRRKLRLSRIARVDERLGARGLSTAKRLRRTA
jgi:hypothetical protein